MTQKIKVFLSSFILILVFNCNVANEDVKTISLNGNWHKNAEQKFDFEINDIQSPKNIIFVVRNNNDYPYSNIRFFVNFTNLQTKKTQIDTLNYILAKPNGEWLGKGFGETKEILFQYKMNHLFKEKGKYRIGIKQAMRKDNLPGIQDLGIIVQN